MPVIAMDAPGAVPAVSAASAMPAAPSFDIGAARAAARRIARDDGQDVAARLDRKLAGETTGERLQKSFERARRPDCLRASTSMNLLANVASLAKDIVANAVDDSGCKW